MDDSLTTPMTNPLRAWSARRYLLALSVAVILPALVFAGIVAWLYAERERERYQSQVIELARDILTGVERELGGIEAAVQALSTSRTLKRADYATFYEQAIEAKVFNGTNIVVRDGSGQQLVNTRRPFGEKLPRNDTEADRKAAELRGPYVSDLFTGAVAGEPLFIVSTPVFAEDGRTILSSVNMSVPPERIAGVVQQEGVPSGWTAGVLDRRGVIVGRFPNQREFVGQPASTRFMSQATGKEGIYEGTNLQGVAVLTAFVRSSRYGWIVTTSVPKSVLSAPLQRSLWLLAALGALLLALSSAMALGFGRRLAAPIAALSRQASALRSGDQVTPIATNLREVNEVSFEIAKAAHARLKAEQALALSAAQVQREAKERSAILSQLAEGVIITDATGKIIFVNAAASKLHGVAKLDVEPEAYASTYQLLTIDGEPHPIEDLPLARAVMKAETVEDARWRIRRPDGSEVLAIGSARPVLAEDGSRIGSVLTVRDDTQRDRDEREQARLTGALAEQAAELIESNEELQRYAYIVSHDLRAPLVNVMGFTSELDAIREDILAELKDNPKADGLDRDMSEALGFIKAGIAKMEGLIAAILKLSREGRRSLRPETLDMPDLVQGLVDAIRHQIDSVGAVVEVSPDLPQIVCDKVAIEQIVGNILDNAVKYLDHSRPGLIKVTGEDRGARVVYRIADNGRGIEARDHARVFELFRRAGQQDRPGEGIGLAHVKALVRAMGGRITLTSEVGVGTTFTVVLPSVMKRTPNAPTDDDA
jgi:PAS domain S-box-containing protein